MGRWTARAAWVGPGPHLDGPGPWVEEGWPLLAIWWAGLSAGLGAALAASTAATSSAVIAVAGLLAPSSLRMA